MPEDAVPTCPQDGFPMIRIQGRLRCVVEHLDRCVGGQRIVDIVKPPGQSARYIFEDGHTLPLICPCCGGPLSIEEKTRKDMIGRRLESMAWVMSEETDRPAYPILYLEFAPKGLFSRRRGVGVSPEVAARLQHPAACSHHPSGASAAPGGKSKRKKRR